MKIYTKTGDKGETSLFGGKRVRKDHIRIEAYGTVDELNSFIGFFSAAIIDDKVLTTLKKIQTTLFTIGSHLAADPEKQLPLPGLPEEDIAMLENEMDQMNEKLSPLKYFILPAGSEAIARAHLCRTICRRAERRIITLQETARVLPWIIQYLNRLSDYFFMLARKLALDAQVQEVPWIPQK
ncbi:MAG TPA: cob(I)yrinic acid a,c-diamide adenosyltransferase [Saprospiraceae bacterium]|nr:cob(I)yrinic acid a,c-diamide adenosyltransferase [Saprospiraceae bacterium]